MEEYEKSFTEVYYIINQMDDSLKKKIPKQVIETIFDKMDKGYIPLGNELSEEGKALLSVIYSEYLCTDQEKKRWDELDSMYYESKVKDNIPIDIFNNNTTEKSADKSNDIIPVQKNNRFKMTIQKLKNIFKSLWKDQRKKNTDNKKKFKITVE